MSIQNINNLGLALQPARSGARGMPETVAAQPAVAVKQTRQQPSPDQLRVVAESINKALKQANNNLEFHVDAGTKITVVKLVDSESGDVIRQFPSEEMLQIARSIDQFQQGLLLKQKA